ncbi:MAG: hypothetical protein HYY04_07650 [Chloroflexi bacterium]|nr:hypothetical protein [Chloroflexota bacterium]
MDALTERLEVPVSPNTVHLLRPEARRRGVPVAHVVREAIDLLLEQDRRVRLRAAEALFQVGAPVADWDQMRREIEEALITADTGFGAVPGIRRTDPSMFPIDRAPGDAE